MQTFASSRSRQPELLAEYAKRVLPYEDRRVAIEKIPFRLIQVIMEVGLLTPEEAQAEGSEAARVRLRAADLFGEMYGFSADDLYQILFEPEPDRNLLLWLEAISFDPKACRRIVSPPLN